MRHWKLLFVAIALLAIAGCAGHNSLLDTPVGDGWSVAGFWNGIWHGMTLPFSFIGSLFDPTINIYEVHNSRENR